MGKTLRNVFAVHPAEIIVHYVMIAGIQQFPLNQ